MASHDLKEPLRMVSSYVSLLERSLKNKLETDDLEFMQFIKSGTKTMHELISDLLIISSISSDNVIEKVDLNKILQNVLTNLHASIKEKMALIHSNNLPTIMADETQMIQLFQNIISNAIKYNDTLVPKIEISFIQKQKIIELTVSDNGIGILPEFRNKIFLIFQRLHSKQEYSGTGIGLAICKKIVDQMHGKIWVSSNENGGVDFNISFSAKLLVQ